MAKIAIFCNSASLAHAGRSVAVARALEAAGHEPVLVGQPHYLESSLLVDRAEFALEVIGAAPPPLVVEPGPDGPVAGGDGMAFAGAVFEELGLLEKLRPDVAFIHGRPTATLSCDIAGVPTVSLTSAAALGPHSGLALSDAEWSELCAPVAAATPTASWAKGARSVSAAIPLSPAIGDFMGRFKVLPRSSLHELAMGTRTMVGDPAALWPLVDVPDSVQAVGPILFDVSTAMPGWWSRLDEGRPVVYASLGSCTSGARSEVADMVFEQLTSVDSQVVVATNDTLPAPPRGLNGCRYLPASRAMSRARAVICDGDRQTMYQALAHRVPLLLLPDRLEQAVSSIPVVRAGAARVLSTSVLAPGSGELAARIAALVADEGARAAAGELARQIDSSAAVSACVAAVNALVG